MPTLAYVALGLFLLLLSALVGPRLLYPRTRGRQALVSDRRSCAFCDARLGTEYGTYSVAKKKDHSFFLTCMDCRAKLDELHVPGQPEGSRATAG